MVGEVKELRQDTREDKVRKQDRDINSIYMGIVKLVAFFLGKRWFPLTFSHCEVQGKLKLLVGFGFIVSLLLYFVRTH